MRSQKKIIFIIDPLDGTFNFSKGFQHACVSIALWKDGILSLA